ncbi:MAG: folate family ECF transporter S component [Bacillota bacterium]
MRVQLSARDVSRIGLLVALSVVLTRFLGFMVNVAGVLGLRISFGEVPIMLAGIMMGPGAGAITGALSDVIGYVINPAGGPYFPGFTLTSALVGVTPWLVLRLTGSIKGQGASAKHQVGFPPLLLAVAVTGLLVSMLLNTYWLHKLYGRAFLALLPTRLVARVILVPLHTFILYVMLRAFQPSRESLGHTDDTGS